MAGDLGRYHGDGAWHGLGADRWLAGGLGCLGIGLGLFELLAPRTLARLLGVAPWAHRGGIPSRFTHALLLRALGLRELTSGIGILTRAHPAPWLWSRVVGDALHLSLLGLVISTRGTRRRQLAGAALAVLGITALDVLAARRLTRPAHGGRARASTPTLEASVCVDRSPEECYAYWRDLANVPRFMRAVDSVRAHGDGRMRWVAHASGGVRLEWDAQITHDAPNQAISWRSLDSAVPHAGTVCFEPAPGGHGTIVRLRLQHALPLHDAPRFPIREDLRRFKQLLETGEIATTRAQPHRRRGFMPHALGGGLD
jgi:uncharacterized membrane protein